MPVSTVIGRMGDTGTYTNTISPKSAEQAMLVKQDEVIAKLNLILAAIAAAVDGNTLEAGLNVPAITTQIKNIKLI